MRCLKLEGVMSRLRIIFWKLFYLKTSKAVTWKKLQQCLDQLFHYERKEGKTALESCRINKGIRLHEEVLFLGSRRKFKSVESWFWHFKAMFLVG